MKLGETAGFIKGYEEGFEKGQKEAVNILADRFDGLHKVPGIGPKLMEKIVNHFGSEYFKAVAEGNEKQTQTGEEIEKISLPST